MSGSGWLRRMSRLKLLREESGNAVLEVGLVVGWDDGEDVACGVGVTRGTFARAHETQETSP